MPAPSTHVKSRSRLRWSWLGAVPFLAYVAVFLIVPVLHVCIEAFRDRLGAPTTANVGTLFQPQYLKAFVQSIKVGLITGAAGSLFGLLVAVAIVDERMPRWLKPAYTTFSGVASHFSGIPLAFAFIATIGNAGVITLLLRDFGIDLYGLGFSIYSVTGLSIVYLYFQFPLMILLIVPALEGLRREWREAATSLGAGRLAFWRYIGLPVLAPSLIGASVALFGSGFAAYATPYALSGGSLNLVPLRIGAALSGNFAIDEQIGFAMAFGMLLVMTSVAIVFGLLQRRASRWVR